MKDIEKAVIGTLIMDNNQWTEIREIVNAEDFTDLSCVMLFKAIEKLDGRCDILILSDKLRKDGNAGLVTFANECMERAMPSVGLTYAEKIKECSRRRKAAQVGDQIKDLAKSDKDLDDVLRFADSQIVELSNTRDKTFRPASSMAIDFLNRQSMLKGKGLEISGLPSGFSKLDFITDGFKGGELIIIGARPSIGKTSLMLNFADHIGIVLKKNVAIFSIESPETEIMNKMVSSRARIKTWKLRTGKMDSEEYDNMMRTVDDIGSSNITVLDLPCVDIIRIRAHVKKLMNKGVTPNIIIIDYLQIIEVEKGPDTIANKIGRVAYGLKNMAKELNIPVVALAQINRANGEEPPRLMDLKDSGAIEAIADMVILLHREEFYKGDDCKLEKKGKIEVDVAKNRNGPTKLIELDWVADFTRIEEKPFYTGEEK